MTISQFTTTQTIGPFFHEGLHWGIEASKSPVAAGALLTITGTVFDGNGATVDDAMIECWTPDGAAAEDQSAMPGFRRADSTDGGRFRLSISANPGNAGAPAAYVTVFARGLLKHSYTAVFLEDDSGLAASEILDQVPAERRATLIARKTSPGEYRWDIRLQGQDETVIFDYA